MDFMTAATVRNLPSYEQNRMERIKYADVQEAKKAEAARISREREILRAIGKDIMSLGPEQMTPQGLQSVVSKYQDVEGFDIGMVPKVAEMVKTFKTKWQPAQVIGPSGGLQSIRYDENNPSNRQIIGDAGLPPTETITEYTNGTPQQSIINPFTQDTVRGPWQSGPSAEQEASIRAAGRTNVTQNNIGESGMEALSKEMGKGLSTERQDVIGAAKGLNSLYEARDLLDKGIITGTGAEFLTNFGNFLSSRLGVKFDNDPVANTQAYAATMGNQVGQIIKQFGSGTGLSDADREYAEKIVGGKVTLNEQALRKLLDINERAYKNVIEEYNSRANQVMGKPGASSLPYDLRVDIPVRKKPRFKIMKVE